MPSANASPAPLKLLLVGLGRVGLKHLKAYRNNRADYRLVGLVDADPARAARLWAEARMPGALPPVYASLDGLPEDLQADVAAVCTPSGSHYALARALLLRGLHCLIEKPMTLDLAEADELIALAEARGLKLALGHIYRFFPLVDLIREDVAAGAYGRVLSGSVHVLWGHDQSYYDAAAWRGSWAQDGGVLMNQCVHALDLMAWLMNAPIRRAQASIARLSHRMEAEDYVLATFTLEGGSLLQLTGTTCTSPARQRAEFALLCEHAEILCGLHKKRPYCKIYDRAGRSVTRRLARRMLRRLRDQGLLRSLRRLLSPHSLIYADFARAIREGGAARADGAAGRQALAAVLAAYASCRAGGRQIPLEGLDFKLEAMQGYFG